MTAPDAALAPVRAALLDRARADAARLLADADDDARRALQAARAEAARVVAAARAQGEADAEEAVAGQRARARTQGRALTLQARRSAYESLRSTARAEARRLAAERPGLTERLAAVARERLGPAAEVSTAPDGTVVAVHGRSRWEWSPEAMADDVVRELGQEVEQLWAP